VALTGRQQTSAAFRGFEQGTEHPLERLGLDLALRFGESFKTELVMIGIQGVLLSVVSVS
jgi:hypothetical protein